ncbi:Shikimate dehydrogenase (NADP(+)) [Buchnera aphidicola (Anoecia corni)]|uniref:Shikimate dehydrogenase (NADP(+)) n=1 Tax=Buchnera aphidicola (Anoecia corni) TaxID=2994477 RepID=A0AAT9IGP4_9GAMM
MNSIVNKKKSKNDSIDNFALFGNPVNHSMSPNIYKNFSKEQGIPLKYKLINVCENNLIKEMELFFSLKNSKGANITVPFKETVVHICNSLTDRAKVSNSVNVIKKLSNGTLLGDNTDGVGLIHDLKTKKFIDKKSNILILGAGGAALGIISVLLEIGSTVFIWNRTIEKAKVLEKRFKHLGDVFYLNFFNKKIHEKKFNLIINATSCSMKNQIPDFPKYLISSNTYCYDLFYSRKNTVFTKFCKKNGAIHCSDGKGMLVSQAAFAFFLWYNKFPNISSSMDSVF